MATITSDQVKDLLTEVKEGYMYKQGGNRRTWKKRYFVLKEGKIDYFKMKDDKKVRGTIDLSTGRGVRVKDQCKCRWPSSVNDEYCFGLAIETRTYYFHTTSSEGKVGEWETIIQSVINKVGAPNSDWGNDKEGKPEEKKSVIARKSASLGAKATKLAMEHAPVNSNIKSGVSGVADIVEGQAEADPHAGPGERIASGVGSGAGAVGKIKIKNKAGKMKGIGKAGKIATKVVKEGAGVAEGICKENDI